MGLPTSNDEALLATISPSDRARVLMAYLVDGDTMIEAGGLLGLSGQTASMTSSTIMRCYGFHGKNSGSLRRFANTVRLSDFEGFVKKYPNGSSDKNDLIAYIGNAVAKREHPPKQPATSVKSQMPKADHSKGYVSQPTKSQMPKPDYSVDYDSRPAGTQTSKPDYVYAYTEPVSFTHVDHSSYKGQSSELGVTLLTIVIMILIFVLTPKWFHVLYYLGLPKLLCYLFCFPVSYIVMIVIVKVGVTVIRAIKGY